ncbi:hypothetical protein CGGC5_v014132 [Colletotrichum fructicola Nara gc5]|uniref:Uncharacterized protein n=1 Tax=Colletotrichum fructicola (strain Nara gc5) TaxID=1213859 RepID=A0A7J6IKQ1_COLFN|nr:hypothetical protein CGGC5_v014132 [Colletotrichum fructicola Nara gc5]
MAHSLEGSRNIDKVNAKLCDLLLKPFFFIKRPTIAQVKVIVILHKIYQSLNDACINQSRVVPQVLAPSA